MANATISPSLQPMANAAPSFSKRMQIYLMKFNTLVDQTTPYTLYRWLFAAVLLLAYSLHILISQGWYLITYALGIYLLNIFLAFLTPKIDPSMAEMVAAEEDSGETLPMKRDDEFRPFIRRLPEFKFWYSAVRAILIAFVLSFTEFTDVPVFWPILLMYFLLLFFLTMRRQIQHMIRYRYIPFDFGKRKYSGGGKK